MEESRAKVLKQLFAINGNTDDEVVVYTALIGQESWNNAEFVQMTNKVLDTN